MTKACLIAFAALAFSSAAWAKGADWDAKGAAEVKAVVEKAYDAWNKGDAETLKALLGDNLWGAWDVDMMMQPAAWANKAEMGKFFDEAAAMMKKMGASATFKTTKLDCKVSGALGICLVEGEQTLKMPSMPPMSVWLRSTEVFTHEKTAWKWTHHHGSVAKEEMPTKFMSASTKASGGWMDAGPDMPGIKVLPIWMNPANMNSVAIMKATQTVKQTRHMHPYPFTFVVLEGAVTTTDGNGRDTEFGPGSVVYRQANEPHVTTIKAGTVVFSVASGPMMQVPVDDKGKPIKQAQN